MSTSVSLQEPFSYSLNLLLALGAAVLLPMLIMLIIKLIMKGKAIAPKKKEKEQPAPPPIDKDRVRGKYLGIINEIEKKYDSKELDDRAAYLELSGAVRNFVHDYTGANTQNMTLNEIGALGMPSLFNLIKEYYRPEFALDSGETDVKKSIDTARKVVMSWS